MSKYDNGLWLKTIGTGDDWVEADWMTQRSDVLERVGFPDRGTPSVQEFDMMAIYLAGHQKIVGIVEVTSDPTWDAKRIKSDPPGRWPWIVTVEPVLIVGHVDRAPHLRDVGIDTLSVRNHSHIRVEDTTWREIVAGLAGAAAVHGERYVAAYPVAA